MAALLREVIGDVLRRVRTSQGRTLREVSDAARVSLGYLSEVERGRKEASSELLTAICGALDVRLSEVLTSAGRRMEQQERVDMAVNIDASTKVVIPQVVSMAADVGALPSQAVGPPARGGRLREEQIAVA